MRPRPDQLCDHREYPVLYVDDEPENLRIFELTFRREFSILTASSGEEGLEILADQPVALVLSDHRMPGMTGSEFLARVAELDPKTVRIMVTAYGDVETLQSAINNGSIYRFIPKPWTPEDVRATLRRGIEAYALDRERDQLVRELTILNRVSHTITQELDLDRLLRLLLDTLVDEMQYDAASMFFFDPKKKTLSLSASQPDDPSVAAGLRALHLSAETAPEFIEKLENGRAHTLRIGDVLDYEAAVRGLATEIAAEELIVQPLYGKEGLIGALAVDNRRGGRRFTSDDRTLLEGLSNQAAIAIENARLVEDLRRSREQVRRADRLGNLGTLAAGLAHEINNPLVSIHTFMSMAPEKRNQNDPEFWGEYYELACREVDRIRGLVDTMRKLGSGNTGLVPRETVDAGALVEGVLTLVQREAAQSQIELEFTVDPEAPKIVAVRDQIHQLVLNLVLNALGASEPGGCVRVRVDAPREGVSIEVKDSGPGIPEEHIEQIFDPFFTTKGPDEGSGLGLMICHRIVTDHGGSIEVDSREGQGATFRVWLPSSDMAPVLQP